MGTTTTAHSGWSNARIFWIIWCLAWAFFWFIMGWFTLLLAWILIPFSLLAILIPVGTGKNLNITNRPPAFHDPSTGRVYSDPSDPDYPVSADAYRKWLKGQRY